MEPVIIMLIVANVIFSYSAFTSQEVMRKAIFNPYLVNANREWWRFITSGFIHADWLHLGVNMLMLYLFGSYTLQIYEAVFEERAIYYFFVMYFGGMIVADLPSYQKHRENPGYNSLGASGAISSVMFAFILYAPLEPLRLYGAIPLPAAVYGALYLVYSHYAAKRAQDNIGHEAHFWGAVFGFVFTGVMKPELFTNFIDAVTSLFQ